MSKQTITRRALLKSALATPLVAGLLGCRASDTDSAALTTGDRLLDLVIVDANIITMDDAHPRVEAVAIKNGRFIAVGSSRDIRALTRPGTQTLSLLGKTVLPGLHVISPIVYQRVRALDPRGWKSLATHVANSHNGTLTFLNAFQARLSPEQISDLLDLQEALSSSLTFYTVFRDLAGVPENQLPQTRTPPEMLQQSGYEATAKDIQTALALVEKLSQSIAQDA